MPIGLIPVREFNGTIGSTSTLFGGPDQVEADLDKLIKMFNPAVLHADGATSGGIGSNNLQAGAVNDAAIGNLTPDQAYAVAFAGVGKLSVILSIMARTLVGITGKANYYTNPSATIEAILTSIALGVSNLTTHKSSNDHDGRYYTETELNAGQLDTRYYTETELNAGQLNNLYFTETEINAKVDSLLADISADVGNLNTHKTSTDHDNRYYAESEIDAFLTALKGIGYTTETLKGLHDIADGLQTQITNLNSVYSTDAERIAAINNVIAQFELADDDLTTLIANKANIADVYTKTQTDNKTWGTASIVDLAITNAKLALLSVKTANIEDAAVTADKLHPSLLENVILTMHRGLSTLDHPDESVTDAKMATDAKVGSLTTLSALLTGFKTSAVVAINKLVVFIGDITALTTTVKTSIVLAINELVTSLTQAKGSNIDLARCYGENVKQPFDGTETWTSVAGTQSNDTTNVKVGSQSLKILENDNTAGLLFSSISGLSLNFTLFPDGSASTTADYIKFPPFYISDVTKVDTAAGKGVEFDFETTNGNYYRFVIVAGLVTGWNFIELAKSVATTVGAPNWNSITKIYLNWNSLITSQNAYVSFNTQALALIRKDPSSAYANPLQHKENNAYVRDFAINSGFWFVGLEFGEIVCRDLQYGADTANALVGTKAYTDFIISTKLKIQNPAQYDQFMGVVWYIDASNYVLVRGVSGVMQLRLRVAGANTDYSVTMAYTLNDIIDITLRKRGTSFEVIAFKNNDRSTPYSIVAEGALGSSIGYLAMGQMSGRAQTIKALSITTVEHADTSSKSEFARSLETVWKAWTPTLTWTTATPGTITTVARYTLVGKILFFHCDIRATDGNGATNLTITLPIAPKDNGSINRFEGTQMVSNAYTDAKFYAQNGVATIYMLSPVTCTDNATCGFWINGFYEIA